ncbi:zinc-ribbon domain-containing protein [Tissierella creatinini]|nr:zinc-ribbon domain-containing protein [Tissierella creatinini]TJX60642.1 zinc-ribbon domain-containing protein [Soehngenia saccharolytica]
MSKKFCSNCGNQVNMEDRFCENCGFGIVSEDKVSPAEPAKSGNKKAIKLVASFLALVLIFVGAFNWWLSRDKEPQVSNNKPASTQVEDEKSAPEEIEPTLDLTKASTYLSNPGLDLTFFVNYPDGQSGIVNRISGKAVDHESVKVTEVELGVDMGQEFGFGSHYVERVDGTYIIYDFTPNEIAPILKNNLTTGSSWDYVSENGTITWTVADMGVTLDLDFAVFHNCIIIREDNQAAGFQSLSYYAPGYGIIYVVSPEGGYEYYRLTGVSEISEDEAKDTISKWCPNYLNIKDDRTQN